MTENEAVWHALLSQGSPVKDKATAFFEALPTDPRCMFCHSPFGGVGGRLTPLIGRGQSPEHPRICNACMSFGRKHPGGAQVKLAVVFADVRGSTPMAERIGDQAFSSLINRFFQTSSDVLINAGALLGRLAGDGAIGFFVPGLAGPEYARVALEAAKELMAATGHTGPGEPWVPLGAGVHSGSAYVGMVGTAGSALELTALGDDINVGARLADHAGTGEILASLETCRLAGMETRGLEIRRVELKGKSEPLEVVALGAK